MTTNTIDSKRRVATAGVGRLVRRLERERRSWTRRPDRGDVPVGATGGAWRGGGGWGGPRGGRGGPGGPRGWGWRSSRSARGSDRWLCATDTTAPAGGRRGGPTG